MDTNKAFSFVSLIWRRLEFPVVAQKVSLTEPTKLTRLWEQVSCGGCNGLILGLCCPKCQATTDSSRVLAHPCPCITPFPCGRPLLEHKRSGLPVCVLGVSR